jgi:hypothetical protein
VRLEGLRKLKKSNDLIRNRIRDLPACSTVPQLTTLLRAPGYNGGIIKFWTQLSQLTLNHLFNETETSYIVVQLLAIS